MCRPTNSYFSLVGSRQSRAATGISTVNLRDPFIAANAFCLCSNRTLQACTDAAIESDNALLFEGPSPKLDVQRLSPGGFRLAWGNDDGAESQEIGFRLETAHCVEDFLVDTFLDNHYRKKNHGPNLQCK